MRDWIAIWDAANNRGEDFAVGQASDDTYALGLARGDLARCLARPPVIRVGQSATGTRETGSRTSCLAVVSDTMHRSVSAPCAYSWSSLQLPQPLSLIHISEPTRRTPISYAVFCLKKKKQQNTQPP